MGWDADARGHEPTAGFVYTDGAAMVKAPKLRMTLMPIWIRLGGIGYQKCWPNSMGRTRITTHTHTQASRLITQ